MLRTPAVLLLLALSPGFAAAQWRADPEPFTAAPRVGERTEATPPVPASERLADFRHLHRRERRLMIVAFVFEGLAAGLIAPTLSLGGPVGDDAAIRERRQDRAFIVGLTSLALAYTTSVATAATGFRLDRRLRATGWVGPSGMVPRPGPRSTGLGLVLLPPFAFVSPFVTLGHGVHRGRLLDRLELQLTR